MAYCVVSDVSTDFKDITFDASSSVTDTEVTEFIDQESEYIDGMIAGRYSTPISSVDSPKSYSILKRICVFLVADRVRHVLYIKTGRDRIDQDTKGLKSLSRDPRGDLKKIASGELKLTDATEQTTGIGFEAYDIDCTDLEFDVEKQQW